MEDCPIKNQLNSIKEAVEKIENGAKDKLNAVWIETSGCFGEVISLFDGLTPNIIYLLDKLVNMTYFGSIMADEGDHAYERLLEVMNKDYILIVSGAIPKKDNGLFTVLATYKNEKITASKAIDMLSEKAKHIIAVGTCASFGGPTAANPNISEAVSLREFLNRDDIISIPGCPANLIWTYGILSYLVNNGTPELDYLGRPTAYYGELIHDNCERRRYFDLGIFAKKLGDKECMFMLGCKGPVTYAYCPISKWDLSNNWPVGSSTVCIGCANPGFPDENEPFIQYGGKNL